MRIGTAVPSGSDLAEVPHHFIGTQSVIEDYNVYRFENDVSKLLDQLFRKHEIVFLCGGSGLYVRAISDGIDELPDTDPEIRINLENQYQEFGLPFIQHQLKILDPEYYNIVDLKNPVRIIRALEICLETGKPFSSFRLNRFRPKDFKVIKIGLSMNRSDLFCRIDNRVEEMITEGLITEVEGLRQFRSMQALNTVGYGEIFEFLDGNCSKLEAIEKIKVNTRRYAKKQMTWLRRQEDYYWFHPKQKDGILRIINNFQIGKRKI